VNPAEAPVRPPFSDVDQPGGTAVPTVPPGPEREVARSPARQLDLPAAGASREHLTVVLYLWGLGIQESSPPAHAGAGGSS
jgi:hypothetical protein